VSPSSPLRWEMGRLLMSALADGFGELGGVEIEDSVGCLAGVLGTVPAEFGGHLCHLVFEGLEVVLHLVLLGLEKLVLLSLTFA